MITAPPAGTTHNFNSAFFEAARLTLMRGGMAGRAVSKRAFVLGVNMECVRCGATTDVYLNWPPYFNDEPLCGTCLNLDRHWGFALLQHYRFGLAFLVRCLDHIEDEELANDIRAYLKEQRYWKIHEQVTDF